MMDLRCEGKGCGAPAPCFMELYDPSSGTHRTVRFCEACQTKAVALVVGLIETPYEKKME